jgi:hypothetical protein
MRRQLLLLLPPANSLSWIYWTWFFCEALIPQYANETANVPNTLGLFLSLDLELTKYHDEHASEWIIWTALGIAGRPGFYTT